MWYVGHFSTGYYCNHLEQVLRDVEFIGEIKGSEKNPRIFKGSDENKKQHLKGA